uniref:G_PROTEIN_RECEP_F1_2 domain-containing protein n=1 Tax=Heterorhabditis bacteriophora TaxID=37862 RepID=A0A1I7X7X9_HETBA
MEFSLGSVSFTWQTTAEGYLSASQWYRDSTNLFATILNWFSAVSIWCMMYATIERVQVFRSPFRTSKRSVSPNFLLSIALILGSALVVTSVHFDPLSSRFNEKVVKTWLLLHAVTVVLVPLIVCALLNILLVLALKKNTMPVHMLTDSHSQQTLIVARNKTERKITIMVTVIIASFVVCNAPGAILFIVLRNDLSELNNLMLTTVSNSLAVTGKIKILNYALHLYIYIYIYLIFDINILKYLK